ncbi:MAG: SLC13 family permease [Bacillota bacterium]
MSDSLVFTGLGLVLALVLALPFVFRQVEHNLEAFLFVMGLAAALISGALGLELGLKALKEPVAISLAVLVAGLLFKVFKHYIHGAVDRLLRVVSVPTFVFGLVVILGLFSSVITAIIAALVLVEVVGALNLRRDVEVRLVIIACFAIGLGAALTPVGEPLATITVSKLGADFWYIARLLGPHIVFGVVALAAFAALYLRPTRMLPDPEQVRGPLAREALRGATLQAPRGEESYQEVVVRALKVYLFVMALVLLGEGFKPAIDRFVIGLSSPVLYWLNTVSAVLDNATLAAAEISPKMHVAQLRSVLMGLLVAGGMLIPGNIPNIISAGKLRLRSREWANLGLPLGFALLVFYFVVMMLLELVGA